MTPQAQLQRETSVCEDADVELPYSVSPLLVRIHTCPPPANSPASPQTCCT